MVFKYCLGMIMSVSTLIIFSGAATPSRIVNFSISAFPAGPHFALEHDLFPKTGIHFSGSCSGTRRPKHAAQALHGAWPVVGQPCAAVAGSLALNLDSRSSVQTWMWYSVSTSPAPAFAPQHAPCWC